MRIMVQCNAPWVGTGYGVVARNLLPRFQKMGHEVACFAFCGLFGGRFQWQGIECFPIFHEVWGRDAMVPLSRFWGADIFMTIYDTWTTPELGDMDLKWVPYAPVDHEPAPPGVVNVLRKAYRVASMSRSGQQLLADAGIASTPIPHGVDTSIYRPLGRKDDMKRRFGFDPSDFVIGIVAMNKGMRKNYDDLFRTVAGLRQRHSNVKLFVHTNPMAPEGQNLVQMAQFCGVGDIVRWTDSTMYHIGLAPGVMAELYNAFDLTLMTTAGEGFGLPTLESQACGTPVITNDFTTGRELNAHPELVIPPSALWVSPQAAYQARTNVEAAIEAADQVYLNGSEHYAERCAAMGATYSWDNVAEKWRVFFEEIEADLFTGGLQPATAAQEVAS